MKDLLPCLLPLSLIAAAVLWAFHRRKKIGETWTEVAREQGLRVSIGKFSDRRALHGKVDGKRVKVDTLVRGKDEQREAFTRYQVQYPSLGLGLTIREQRPLRGLPARNRERDIQVGDQEFDARFRVLGRDPERVLAFLTPERRLRLLRADSAFAELVVRDTRASGIRSGPEARPEVLKASLLQMVRLANSLSSGTQPREHPEEAPDAAVEGGLATAADSLDRSQEVAAPSPQGRTAEAELLFELGEYERSRELLEEVARDEHGRDRVALMLEEARENGGRLVYRLPHLGPDGHEGRIVAWHAGVGETVARDVPVVEVLTEGARVQITSPADGVVAALGGAEGDTIAAGRELFELDVVDEALEAPAPPVPLTPTGADVSPAAAEVAGPHAPAEPVARAELPAPTEPLAPAEMDAPPGPTEAPAPTGPPPPVEVAPGDLDETMTLVPEPHTDPAGASALLFEDNELGFRVAARFEGELQGRFVRWSGELVRVTGYYSDLVFGSEPGTRANVKIAEANGREVHATLGLPPGAEEALKARMGETLSFEGWLVRCDAFMRILFVSEARITE